MKKAAIIIHGLTGTPASIAPLTEALSSSGFKVVTPLLPGHGTNVEELAGSGYEEWKRAVAGAYDGLKAEGYEDISCAGLSLGSLLTLNLALDKSRPLRKIACMGTPLKLSSVLEKVALPFSHLPVVRSLIRMSGKDWESSVKDPVGREMYRSASYSKIPVHSVWELQRLQKEMIPRLSEIRTPLMIVHSKNDKVAPPCNVEFLTERLSVQANVLWVFRSEHVLTLDLEREVVIGKVLQFFSN